MNFPDRETCQASRTRHHTLICVTELLFVFVFDSQGNSGYGFRWASSLSCVQQWLEQPLLTHRYFPCSGGYRCRLHTLRLWTCHTALMHPHFLRSKKKRTTIHLLARLSAAMLSSVLNHDRIISSKPLTTAALSSPIRDSGTSSEVYSTSLKHLHPSQWYPASTRPNLTIASGTWQVLQRLL